MKMTTRSTHSVHSWLRRSVLLFVSLLIGVYAISSNAEAVNPPPDGGYSGGNTAEGQDALRGLTTGTYNTATGIYSLFSLTTGSLNTAIGAGTLLFNTADENTAIGVGALFSNTTGARNTANGVDALFFNTTGHDNTANGTGALQGNTTGFFNTATGTFALSSNSTGFDNTANSYGVLINNTTGHDNTASGFNALGLNITGNNNTANGVLALVNNTTGSNNTAVGLSAGMNATTGSNNVYIGAGMAGVAGESNACYIASIFGQTSADGVAVLINSNNKLGTATSSKRFKDDIKPMDKASEALFALKPVSFRYKKEIDSAGTSQLGLVAEEVEKVNPDLVVHDKEGKPYGVRYEQVNAMLLNEFLKEHRKVQKLEANAALQQKQIEALTSGLDRVSAQLESSQPTKQVVLKDR
jgi:trimeric autotransporter adhesin